MTRARVVRVVLATTAPVWWILSCVARIAFPSAGDLSE